MSSVDLAHRQLRAAILDGRHPVGSRLPPERQLATALEVNRSTLRGALSRLLNEGLVEARQGSGYTVLPWRQTGAVGLLPHLIDHGDVDVFASFLVLRRAVAVEAIAQACVRATAEQLDELEALALRLSQETDLEQLALGNLAFGRRVVQLAGNLPMELLFNTITDVYRRRPELLHVLDHNADAVRLSFPAIVALIRFGDADRARRAVRQTLEAIDEANIAAHRETS